MASGIRPHLPLLHHRRRFNSLRRLNIQLRQGNQSSPVFICHHHRELLLRGIHVLQGLFGGRRCGRFSSQSAFLVFGPWCWRSPSRKIVCLLRAVCKKNREPCCTENQPSDEDHPITRSIINSRFKERERLKLPAVDLLLDCVAD